MKVFKATNERMQCTMGIGTFQYALGVPAEAKGAKCGREGLHACEYVIDCLRYYPLGGGNRYFCGEAEGDIAEDGENTRISCIKLTLKKELSTREIAGEAILYMVSHPRREGWALKMNMVLVEVDEAEASESGAIAIARGRDPRARGPAGAHLGLIKESEDGEILDAKLLTVGGDYKPLTWYRLRDRQAEEEKEEDGI